MVALITILGWLVILAVAALIGADELETKIMVWRFRRNEPRQEEVTE